MHRPPGVAAVADGVFPTGPRREWNALAGDAGLTRSPDSIQSPIPACTPSVAESPHPTPGGREFIGEPVEAPPYTGSKAHFLIEGRIDDREWLTTLTVITAREVPTPKPKRRPSA
jgi:hypothetical protein